MTSSHFHSKGLQTGKEVYIVTTGQINSARTAGARRVMNIARSLSYGGVKVIVFSFFDFLNLSEDVNEIERSIYGYCKSKPSLSVNHRSVRQFLRVSNRHMTASRSEAVVFLYPTTFIFRDFVYLLYFKYIKGYRFFCEINELRSAIAFSSKIPEGLFRRFTYLLKSVRDWVIYSANEWQVRLYDGIIVISVALERYFIRHSRRLMRIPILCNSDDVTVDSVPQLFDGGVFKICFAGYVKIDKEGFDILIESLSSVSQSHSVKLYIYGIMEEEDCIRLKKLTDKYRLSGHVHYKGNIDPEELQDEFKQYHLLILPRPLNKRTMYGLSTKLSEYLVSGTPVLVTDVSDNALFIKDKYNGFIIQPGSAEVMANKISEIIGLYNIQAPEVVKNAHRTVIEKLDYRLFSQQYIDFFFKEHNV